MSQLLTVSEIEKRDATRPWPCSACSGNTIHTCDLCDKPMCDDCRIYGYTSRDAPPCMAYHRFCINKPENPLNGETLEREYRCSVCNESGNGSNLRGCNSDGCTNAVHLSCGIKTMVYEGRNIYSCPSCLGDCYPDQE